jgi:DNA (cytosine-5)-methyltransferase 1
MAAFKVKWGFDHWNHACAYWRSNFSTAACYEMPSEKVVSMPRGSKHRAPTDMKVDVLHLVSSSLGSYCQWHQ